MASDTTPQGNILVDSEATWSANETLAVNAVDNPTQLPWPTPADAAGRFTAKKSNSFSEAFRKLVRWLQGTDAAGSASAPVRFVGGIAIGDGPQVIKVDADPEGVVTAPQGTIALRTNGVAGKTVYEKHTGSGNTGWGALGGAPVVEAIDTTGMVNVEGAWHFDGDLLDASGNAYHLVASGATARYVMREGKQAICGWSALRLDEAAGPGNSPLLQITGELTVHHLVWPNIVGAGSEFFLFGFGASGESLATNHLYAIKVLSTGELQFFGEYGAGGSDTTGSFEVTLPLGEWSLVTLTRDAAGTGIKLYLDGTLVASLTLANAAAGGTSAEIYLTAAQCYHGGLVICADEQDAATVLAVAQQVGVA